MDVAWGAVSIVNNSVLQNLKEYENDLIILKWILMEQSGQLWRCVENGEQ